ncbi:hypothetical protein GA0115239_12932 [Streptomyces sp. BpilaLS-43]|nr:hypothetical protein GA0115239_12932 [Streptomyces sp. BpilaLS-43]
MPFRFGVGARTCRPAGEPGRHPRHRCLSPIIHPPGRPRRSGHPGGQPSPASRNRPARQDQAWKPLHATEVYSVGPPSTWYSTTVQSPRSSPTGSASTVRSAKWPRKSSG